MNIKIVGKGFNRPLETIHSNITSYFEATCKCQIGITGGDEEFRLWKYPAIQRRPAGHHLEMTRSLQSPLTQSWG